MLRSQLERSGFAILADVFSKEEMKALLSKIEDAGLTRSRAGIRQALSIPEVEELACASHLIAIVRALLGPDAFPFSATLFDKSTTENWLVAWHQDRALPLRRKRVSPGWGTWSRKQGILYANAPAPVLNRMLAVRIHLDDSRADNGPLRVLGGTHNLGVLNDNSIRDIVKVVEHTECLGAAGSVVLMRPLIIHASSKSRSEARRRVLHIEYADSVAVGSALELAKVQAVAVQN